MNNFFFFSFTIYPKI